MFAYCLNDPINNVDPNGDFSIPLSKLNQFMLLGGSGGNGRLSAYGGYYSGSSSGSAGLAGTVVIAASAAVVGKSLNEVCTESEQNSEVKREAVTTQPQNYTTYYHVTTLESALSIISTGIMYGSKWEGGYVYAWLNKPSKYAIENSGAHMGVIISFKTNAIFSPDSGIENPKAKIYFPVKTNGPIVVWDVKILE